MPSDTNSAKTATYQVPLAAPQVANDDSVRHLDPPSQENTLQKEILEGNFNSAIPSINALIQDPHQAKVDLPLHHKRLLLEGGYYSLITALNPADSESPLANLANFMSGLRGVSERQIRKQLNDYKDDFDNAILTSQLCSTGVMFGVLPRHLIHEGVDLLSTLAARLESTGDLIKASEVYLRLGAVISVSINKGSAIARTLYRHVKEIAPTLAIQNEATVKELEATFLTLPRDGKELIKTLQELVSGTLTVPNAVRPQLILRLAETLSKRGITAPEYIEHAVVLAENSGNKTTTFQGLLSLVNILLARGDSFNANRLLISAEKLCESMRFPVGLLSCQVSRVHIMITQGERDASKAQVRALVDSARSLPGGLAYALAISVFCDQLGMRLEGDSLRDWGLKCFKRNSATSLEALALQTKANSLAHRGDNKRACLAYSQLEKLHRKRGEDAEAIEAKALALQIKLLDIATCIGNTSINKRREHSRIIGETVKLLESLPPGEGVKLRARLSQIQGQMLYVNKSYAEAEKTLRLAKELFISLGDTTNSAFISGLLGLAQLEMAHQNSEPREELLISAEENIVAAAKAFNNARIRGEEARMWKMAAVASLERASYYLSNQDKTVNIPDNKSTATQVLNLKVNSESYLELAWLALSELHALNRMEQEAPTSVKSIGKDQRQIINLALEVTIELSRYLKDGDITLEKWRTRATEGDESIVVQ